MKGLDGTTTAQRDRAADAVTDRSDASLIDAVDHVTLNRLTGQWWEDHRDEFAQAFEEGTPDTWPELARRKAAALDEYCANAIREGMAAGSVPLPDQFTDD